MDLTSTIAPKSDQVNADDLMAGPITVTVGAVKKGTPEQPVDVVLVEFPDRVYRPSKSMRRVMVVAWGADADLYTGRRLTLFRNPDIMFGKDKVGGIEISHLSDISGPVTVALTTTRSKRKSFTVEPLRSRDWLAELKVAGDDLGAVMALGSAASAARAPELDLIRARYNELKA